MITVEYPPGAVDPVHRHHADAFVYVLEGAIVMQVKGGEPMTLSAGQSFYEAPGDIHTVGRNASQTEPAKYRSEEHTSEIKALKRISCAVIGLKQTKQKKHK